ncbi:hypothetical protein PO909_032351 [Leuciscus waleckii]
MTGIWASQLLLNPETPAWISAQKVVNLQTLPSDEADPSLTLMFPVRALCLYVDNMQSFRTSEQLFVCYGGHQKGNTVSKQRLAHWIVDAIIYKQLIGKGTGSVSRLQCYSPLRMGCKRLSCSPVWFPCWRAHVFPFAESTLPSLYFTLATIETRIYYRNLPYVALP